MLGCFSPRLWPLVDSPYDWYAVQVRPLTKHARLALLESHTVTVSLEQFFVCRDYVDVHFLHDDAVVFLPRPSH